MCQDNTNTEPDTAGNQNFKFVPLERIIPGINPYLTGVLLEVPAAVTG